MSDSLILGEGWVSLANYKEGRWREDHWQENRALYPLAVMNWGLAKGQSF